MMCLAYRLTPVVMQWLPIVARSKTSLRRLDEAPESEPPTKKQKKDPTRGPLWAAMQQFVKHL